MFVIGHFRGFDHVWEAFCELHSAVLPVGHFHGFGLVCGAFCNFVCSVLRVELHWFLVICCCLLLMDNL